MQEAVIQNATETQIILEEAALIHCAKRLNFKNEIPGKEKVERFILSEQSSRILNQPDKLIRYRGEMPRLRDKIVANVTKLVEKDMASAELVYLGQAVGMLTTAGEVTKTQIMKFLDAVKSLKAAKLDSGKIAGLLPHLAYAVGRKSELDPLLRVLEPWFHKMRGLSGDELEAAFLSFAKFVETIVAFHTLYEKADRR